MVFSLPGWVLSFLLGSGAMGILLKTIPSTIDEEEEEDGEGFHPRVLILAAPFGAVPLRKPKIIIKDCRHQPLLLLNISG